MSVESVHEQVVAALKTRLAGIIGDSGATYWFSPSAVVRAAALTQECLDSSLGSPATIYVLSPGEEEHERATLGGADGKYFADMRVDLSLCQRFTPPTENPHNPPDPDRWKVQSRMLQDVTKRLLADSTLGGVAINLAIPTHHREAEETFELGWAIAFARVRVLYAYPETQP